MEEEVTFRLSDVAKDPHPGDCVVLRGGQVSWIVLEVERDNVLDGLPDPVEGVEPEIDVLAERSEEVRGQEPVTSRVVMGLDAWRDLVTFGASTASRAEKWRKK
jgi:hypothetical protein